MSVSIYQDWLFMNEARGNTYSRCVCFWECRDSPKIIPVSSSTAAPVSSQLVSIPKTNLGRTAVKALLDVMCFIQQRTGPFKTHGNIL